MRTLIILGGFGTIVDAGTTTEFKAGETILIPAIYEGVMRFSAESEYLTVTI
jgi:hypothetical protein